MVGLLPLKKGDSRDLAFFYTPPPPESKSYEYTFRWQLPANQEKKPQNETYSCWPLDFGRLASRTLRNKFFVGEVTQSVVQSALNICKFQPTDSTTD
jgi:hypothetical protein